MKIEHNLVFKVDCAPNVLENLQDQTFYIPENNVQNQIRGFVKQKWKLQTGTNFNSFQNQTTRRL